MDGFGWIEGWMGRLVGFWVDGWMDERTDIPKFEDGIKFKQTFQNLRME